MNRCCFCLDDIEHHHGNLQFPGRVDRWICGTCAIWVQTTLYLRDQEELRRHLNEEVKQIERHAEELQTGASGCTGYAAKWCPNCGDCKCNMLPDGERISDQDGDIRNECPLHGGRSLHSTDDKV